MGTRFELVIADEGDPALLRAAGEAAIDEIRIAHDRLNRFAPGSLPTRLATSPPGTRVSLDRDTFALFQDAQTVWRSSAGAFDPSLGDGFDCLSLDPNGLAVMMTRPGVRLDFGGIAKGHALDLASAVLRAGGIQHAFLHGGTSSALGMGHPADRTGWSVQVAHIAGLIEPGAVPVILTDRAMSVSAAWVDNPHPTLDPRTGQPVPAPRRAVVVGPTARLADAWSTATLVLGRRPEVLPGDWQVQLSQPGSGAPEPGRIPLAHHSDRTEGAPPLPQEDQ